MSVSPTPTELLALAKASPNGPTEWEVAFHEACHVVAEVVLCRSYPDEVHLNDDPDDETHAGRTSGRSFLGHRPVGGWAGSADDEVIAAMEIMTEQYGVVLAAGRVGSLLARGQELEVCDLADEVLDSFYPPIEGSDEALLADLVGNLDAGAAEAWIEAKYGLASDLLRDHWGRVKTLATALLDRRQLDREDLWDLFEDDMRSAQDGGS